MRLNRASAPTPLLLGRQTRSSQTPTSQRPNRNLTRSTACRSKMCNGSRRPSHFDPIFAPSSMPFKSTPVRHRGPSLCSRRAVARHSIILDNDGLGMVWQSGTMLTGTPFETPCIEAHCTDEPQPCAVCRKTTWHGWLCLDGGEWVCRSHVLLKKVKR